MEETSNKEDAPVVFLDHTSRATRGKRMTKLLDDEIEEDGLLWNQDSLKSNKNDIAVNKRTAYNEYGWSEENDDNYVEEAELADEFDCDFDQDEPEPDGGGENDAEERQAERDPIRADLQATMKPIKRKKEGEKKRMTQEEMLLEAAQTEIMNLRNLECNLAGEEEVKKRAIVHEAVHSGPQIQYSSKDGYSYLEFSKGGTSFQLEISTTSVPYSEKAVCGVTELPANFVDENSGVPKEMDMGTLFDSLSEKDSLPRQRR
ncbi:hypothetical protein Pint_21440 [Pistacia integerrima]|uniref:Uncharacterized protein n=1 Tax=Pistacia integerrima TaxID=434235 RepID=A0ACC0XCH1_9ROSI|nr:hypothetical protein Pint_21440 [Pistacia integerrima]